MKDFDLYCTRCNCTLPVGSPPDKEYCSKCWKIHRKNYNRQKYLATSIRKKTKQFYDFQKISLIQSPYFVDRRKIELTI